MVGGTPYWLPFYKGFFHAINIKINIFHSLFPSFKTNWCLPHEKGIIYDKDWNLNELVYQACH